MSTDAGEEYPEVYSDETRKARKEHRCDACRETIAARMLKRVEASTEDDEHVHYADLIERGYPHERPWVRAFEGLLALGLVEEDLCSKCNATDDQGPTVVTLTDAGRAFLATMREKEHAQ